MYEKSLRAVRHPRFTANVKGNDCIPTRSPLYRSSTNVKHHSVRTQLSEMLLRTMHAMSIHHTRARMLSTQHCPIHMHDICGIVHTAIAALICRYWTLRATWAECFLVSFVNVPSTVR
jgi:hypothetical protein